MCNALEVVYPIISSIGVVQSILKLCFSGEMQKSFLVILFSAEWMKDPWRGSISAAPQANMRGSLFLQALEQSSVLSFF